MRIIIAAIIVALSIAGFSGYRLYQNLNERVVALETKIDQAANEVTSLKGAVAESNRSLSDLKQRAEPRLIASVLLETAKDDLVARIAAKLVETPEHAAALRGRQGEPADPEKVAEALSRAKFDRRVADAFWTLHREEITRSPDLVAGVAGAVYEKYGSDLKGVPGQSPTAKDIAVILADDLAFAQLVGEALPKQ